MATPLSPTPSAALNYSTPSGLRHETFDDRLYSARSTPPQQSASDNTENNGGANGDEDSSPFLSHVKDESIVSPTTRGPSPPKARPGSRIISGHELSPLKILQQQQQKNQIQTQTRGQQQPQSSTSEGASNPSPAKSMPPPPLPQSPRKAPIKRFPVKVNRPGSVASESSRRSSRQSLEEHQSSTEQQQQQEQQQQPPQRTSLQGSVHENEGLKHVIDIFEDEVDALHEGEDDGDDDDNGDSTLLMDLDPAGRHEQSHQDDQPAAADDTMISTFSSFSSFSAVPNMTMFAQMRSNSPTKFSVGGATPRATPRAGRVAGQPAPTPSSSSNPVAATPQRPGSGNNLVNLLDFDLPPMPTPRSVPTITPRELESLKSRFLSEISSLKASLSGKEAEVLSLKTAVGDAEKRVGQCMEQLREVQGAHEALAAEKDSWEKRGREMEAVLRKVKEEIVISQREREELEFKLDEAEKRREAAEMMAQEAESKMAGMRAGKASAEAAAAAGGNGPAVAMSNKEVEIAVTRVARELHALYKNKHEQKIAALKKSYEKRWEKKVRELQDRVDELAREKEELHAREGGGGHDDNGLAAARLAELEEEHRAERARSAAQIRELQAEVEKVEAVLKTVQADNAELRVLLERERVEKGELVMLAEEMMNMQQSFIAQPEEEEPKPVEPSPLPPPPPAPAAAAKTPNRRQSSSAATAARTTPHAAARMTSENNHNNNNNNNNNNFRMSTGPAGFRASGLRAPGSSMGIGGLKSSSTESRIGRVAQHERTKSAAVMGVGGGGYGGSGVPRPHSGQGLRGVGGGGGGGGGGGAGGGGIMSSIERMGSYGGQYRG